MRDPPQRAAADEAALAQRRRAERHAAWIDRAEEAAMEHGHRRTAEEAEIARLLASPVEVVVKHVVHNYHLPTRRALEHLDQLLDAVMLDNATELDSKESLQRLRKQFDQLSSEIVLHMEKEEQVLFPAVVERHKKPKHVQDAIEHEHATIDRLLFGLRNAAEDVPKPDDALHGFILGLFALERDLRVHLFVEEKGIFER